MGKLGLMAGVASIAMFAGHGAAFAQVAPTNAELAARLEALEAELQDAELRSADAINNPPPAAHVAESGAHKFSLVSADGNFSLALTGRIHLDVGDYLNYSPATLNANAGGNTVQRLSSGFNARRARIGVTGKAFGDWSYQFIYDGGNSQDSSAGGIEWAQVSYNGWKGVIVDLPGYSEPAYTLDTATSSNDIMFMERATPDNIATGLNAGDFRANTGVRFFGDDYFAAAYLTGPTATGGAGGDSHTNVLERMGAFQRVTFQVATGDNYSVHLGFDADELLQAPDAGIGATSVKQVTLSDRPELRIDPTAFASTGAIGSAAHPVHGATVLSGEAAAQYDNFYAQGEYFDYSVNRVGLTNANFWGAYAQAAWTLTGEHRSYNPSTASYSSITPAAPFSLKDGTWGAWEIAIRYSYANLVDQYDPTVAIASQPMAVNGGKQSDITVGVNWYVNNYMRMMFNYVHSDYSKAAGAAVAASTSPFVAPAIAVGSPVGMKMDAIALRTQIAW